MEWLWVEVEAEPSKFDTAWCGQECWRVGRPLWVEIALVNLDTAPSSAETASCNLGVYRLGRSSKIENSPLKIRSI